MSYDEKIAMMREQLGEVAVKAFELQVVLDESFAGDYQVAYAYGNDEAPAKVYERVTEHGAKTMGMAHEDYKELLADVYAYLDAIDETSV